MFPQRILLPVLLTIFYCTLLRADILLDQVAMIINKNVVMQSELYAAVASYKQDLRQRGQSIPDEASLMRQVADQIILTRIQLDMAQSAGIRVSDQEINAAMLAMASHHYLTLDELRIALEQQGQSYRDVRSELERQLRIRKLQQAIVSDRIQVSEQEVNDFLTTERGRAVANLDYQLFYIRVPLAGSATARHDPSSERAQALDQVYSYLQLDATQALRYLDQQKITYIDKYFPWQKLKEMPSLFADVVPSLLVGEVHPPIRNADGFHFIKLLAVQSDTPEYIEEVKVRHILLKPDVIRGTEQTRLLLEDIRARILQGADFNELAVTYSEDVHSAADGGILDWSNPDIYTPDFRHQVISLPPGRLSPVFQTEFGWHVVEVLDRRRVDMAMQTERNRIKQFIFQQKLNDALPRWLHELRSSAYIEVPDPQLKAMING